MAVEVILPRVDMDMATGQIARWFVEPGSAVEKGQPLFEIETDKAAMEIEAPASGILLKPAQTGVQIAVGSPVAWIGSAGEAVGSTEPQSVAATAAAPPRQDPLVADGTALPSDRAISLPGSAPDATQAVRATPLARRLARERGFDLSTIAGSGPRGRIQARDVATGPHVASRPSAGPAEPAPPRRMPPGPSRSLDAAGVHVATLREGAGDPVVLVHGFGADLDGWRPFLQGFPGDRRVLAVDLPGHGRSAAPTDAGVDALVLAVAEALRENGADSVHLVGHSLGAAVAALVADSGLLSVRSLFLIAPAGLGPEIDGAFINGFGRAMGEAALAAWMTRLVADPATITPALVRATARARAARRTAAGHETVAAMAFPEGTQAFTILPALDRLAVPIRAVVGLDDAVIPARHAAALPGSVAVHRLRGVGHMPQLEARDLVARLLAEHLRAAG